MTEQPKDALDTIEWGELLTSFAHAYSKFNIYDVDIKSKAIDNYIREHFTPKKEAENEP